MKIRGINEDRCIACKACVERCRRFTFDEHQQKVTFSDPDFSCIDCGHCLVLCPVDAIEHVDLGDVMVETSSIPASQRAVPYENLFNMMRVHRSIRRYKPDPVPRDVLAKVIDAMRYAPTGMNMRSEKFVVISSTDVIRQLSGAVIEALMANPGAKAAYEKTFAWLASKFKAPAYFDAPHVIIGYSQMDMDIEDTNLGIVMTYGRLAAEALGLGTCWNGWTQMAIKGNKDMQKLSGAKGVRFAAMTLGYPAVQYPRSAPRPPPKVKWVD